MASDAPVFKQQLDANGVPLSEPSICIPRVFRNIGEKRIFAIFRELRVGFVDKIDMVERTDKDGKTYNTVFVHFTHWFVKDEAADALRERLLANEQVKIVYDEPWFWKIRAYKPRQAAEPKSTDEERKSRPRPVVDFEFREVVNKRKQRESRPAPPERESRPAPPERAPPKLEQPQQPNNIYSVLGVDVMAGEGRETTDPQETTDESAQVVA
jgi:hypothetical protein